MMDITIQAEIRKHEIRIEQLRIDWKNEKLLGKKKFIEKLAKAHKSDIERLKKKL